MQAAPDDKTESRRPNNDRSVTFLMMGGYLFLSVSALALAVLVYMVWRNEGYNALGPVDGWNLAMLFSAHIILLLAALLGALIGYGLLRSAGAAFKEIIPEKDAELLYELLRGDETTGLDNYVKLASLSGIVGACFKPGITGLPLATIALTVFFAILGLIPSPESQSFFDLSKLTLGAFIGSFVQRSRLTFEERQGGEAIDTPANVS